MYKKLLLVFLSIMALSAAKAQTEKGNQSLGLNFGISTNNFTTQTIDYTTNYSVPVKGRQTNYSIAPTYNYFIADKLDLGLTVGYSNIKQTLDNSNIIQTNQRVNGFFGRVQARKYFLYNNKIGVRTGPYISYERSNQTYFDDSHQNDTHTSSNIYAGGFGLDFVYYPVKRLGVAATVGNLSYTHQKTSGYQKATYNTFNFSFTNSLSLSVNYVFGQ